MRPDAANTSPEQQAIDSAADAPGGGGADDGGLTKTALDGMHGEYQKLAKSLLGKLNRIGDIKSSLESNPSIVVGELANSLELHTCFNVAVTSLRRASKDVSSKGFRHSFFAVHVRGRCNEFLIHPDHPDIVISFNNLQDPLGCTER